MSALAGLLRLPEEPRIVVNLHLDVTLRCLGWLEDGGAMDEKARLAAILYGIGWARIGGRRAL